MFRYSLKSIFLITVLVAVALFAVRVATSRMPCVVAKVQIPPGFVLTPELLETKMVFGPWVPEGAIHDIGALLRSSPPCGTQETLGVGEILTQSKISAAPTYPRGKLSDGLCHVTLPAPLSPPRGLSRDTCVDIYRVDISEDALDVTPVAFHIPVTSWGKSSITIVFVADEVTMIQKAFWEGGRVYVATHPSDASQVQRRLSKLVATGELLASQEDLALEEMRLTPDVQER